MYIGTNAGINLEEGEFDNLKQMLIMPNEALEYSSLYLIELEQMQGQEPATN